MVLRRKNTDRQSIQNVNSDHLSALKVPQKLKFFVQMPFINISSCKSKSRTIKNNFNHFFGIEDVRSKNHLKNFVR